MEPAGRHTAIVTGANHGIGAAVAAALATRCCAVLCTYLRVDDPAGPGRSPGTSGNVMAEHTDPGGFVGI